jgi:hypothetical protein
VASSLDRASGSCEVCGAPPLSLSPERSCVFCRSPLESADDATGLLDYLAERIPTAETGRGGVFRQGTVRDLQVRAGRIEYRARWRREGLDLHPDAEPAVWVDHLLRDLTEDARGDLERRAALSRAGWAWR